MRLEKMSTVEIEDYFKDSDLVIIPIGATENHGTHLAVGTDFMVPTYLADLICQHTTVLVTPTMPFGSSDHHMGLPGTISIGYEGLYCVAKAIVDSLYPFGARRFIFLNGHGGNDVTLQRVGLEMESKGCLSVTINWWQLSAQLDSRYAGGHGGGQETAAILAIDPSCVKMELYKPLVPKRLSEGLSFNGIRSLSYEGVSIPIHQHTHTNWENGWYGKDDPRFATVEMGEEMLQRTAEIVAKFIEEFKTLQL